MFFETRIIATSILALASKRRPSSNKCLFSLKDYQHEDRVKASSNLLISYSSIVVLG